jgi:hypothetical protein
MSVSDYMRVQFGVQARPVRIVHPLELTLRAGVGEDSDAKGGYKNAYKSLPVTLKYLIRCEIVLKLADYFICF